jgi:m7GpppX diphosphatase
MIQIICIFLFFVLLFVLLYKKYSKLYVIETPEMYNTTILPYLQKTYLENTKWMNDMIHYKTSQIVYYRNSNFLICKDNKWKTDNINDFYILAIPIEKIMTVRNLRQQHIGLLEDMKYRLTKTAEAFKIDSSNLVYFFHYIPSIFQLHLHCCLKTNYHAKNLSRGVYHYEIVLDKLQKDNEYWKKATMNYSLTFNNHIAKELFLK